MAFEEARRDLVHACRLLAKAPGFALAAVGTLALGVGANTAIFSVVNALLIEPLPYREASRLVFVWADQTSEGYPRAPLSGPELDDLDNFEAMTFGPTLPDGGRTLLVVSDDNFRVTQKTVFLLFRLTTPSY